MGQGIIARVLAGRGTIVLAVIAALALVSGGAYAGVKLGKGSVKTKHIAKKAVKAKKIAPNAVKSSHIANGAVGGSDVAQGAIDGGKIGADAVSATTIGDGEVGSSEIADGGVGSADVAAGAIGASHLAAGAVPQPPISSGSVVRIDAAFQNLADIPEQTLLERGAFEVFAKCFRSSNLATASVQSLVYLRSSQNGAVVNGADGSTGEAPNGYLDAGEEKLIGNSGGVLANNTAYSAGAATALVGDQVFSVGVNIFSKAGAVPAGAGTYGGGADAYRCMFHAYEIGEG